MFTPANDSIITRMFFRSFARFYYFAVRCAADTSWDMEQSQVKAALPMLRPGPGRRNPLPALVEAQGLWTTSRWLRWQFWKHKKSCRYIQLVGNQFPKGKAIVLKLCPQSQNRWVFLQKQRGELTCWRYTLNSRIQSQQKGGENISSDLFIYLHWTKLALSSQYPNKQSKNGVESPTRSSLVLQI